MIYVDTSVVVSIVVPEPQSPTAMAWFARAETSLTSSWWLLPEAHSAISLKRRLKHISDAQEAMARRELEHFIKNAVRLIPASIDVFKLAARLTSQHHQNLRAGDALHVASAKISGAKSLATFDTVMARTVEMNGIANVFNHSA